MVAGNEISRPADLQILHPASVDYLSVEALVRLQYFCCPIVGRMLICSLFLLTCLNALAFSRGIGFDIIAKAFSMRSQSAVTNNTFAITFVNGIYHSVQDWKDITHDIKGLFGMDVRPFYNPSSGWWVKDATEAGVNLVLRRNDLELARGLADHLRSALQDVGPHGRVLHIAHSGGAILTYLAAKHHLSHQEKNRIDVITLGGGKSITRKYFPGRVFNYYARNDPLTILDNRAGKLLRRTSNQTYDIVRDAKHNTTFVYLAAQANHPLIDHSMLGPTYKYALYLEAEAFKERLQALVSNRLRKTGIVYALRKGSARLTGIHHFWSRSMVMGISQWPRRSRKFAAKLTGQRGFLSGKQIKEKCESIPKSQELPIKLFYETESLEAFEFLYSR